MKPFDGAKLRAAGSERRSILVATKNRGTVRYEGYIGALRATARRRTLRTEPKVRGLWRAAFTSSRLGGAPPCLSGSIKRVAAGGSAPTSADGKTSSLKDPCSSQPKSALLHPPCNDSRAAEAKRDPRLMERLLSVVLNGAAQARYPRRPNAPGAAGAGVNYTRARAKRARRPRASQP